MWIPRGNLSRNIHLTSDGGYRNVADAQLNLRSRDAAVGGWEGVAGETGRPHVETSYPAFHGSITDLIHVHVLDFVCVFVKCVHA